MKITVNYFFYFQRTVPTMCNHLLLKSLNFILIKNKISIDFELNDLIKLEKLGEKIAWVMFELCT